jgi:hypothetical protein
MNNIYEDEGAIEMGHTACERCANNTQYIREEREKDHS